MDKISLVDLEIFAHHGVYEEEKINGQTFYVSCECALSTRQAGKNDALDQALNYGTLAVRITELFQSRVFNLLEAVGEYVAENILKEFSIIDHLTLTIKKPSAPIGLPLQYPSLTITRGWHDVILALGSNIEPRTAHLEHALEALEQHPDIRLLRHSSWIETEPVGYTNQDRFMNGACQIKTLLTPQELLETIHDIEANEKRERLIHWGPRTLDIDIIYYDDLLLHTKDLTIPHPLSLERDFVLAPIAEIAPYRRDPRNGKVIADIYQK